MIIATDNLNYEVIKAYIGNTDGLICYVESLVPKWLRHVTPIVHNQRYYVAIHLRQLQSIPFKEREKMVNALVSNIRLQGAMDCFFTIDVILNQCNITDLIAMLESDLNNEQ